MKMFKIIAALSIAIASLVPAAADAQRWGPGWHRYHGRGWHRPGWRGPVYYGRRGRHYGYYGYRGGYHRNCVYRGGPRGRRYRCY